jgi:hypothetical protein
MFWRCKTILQSLLFRRVVTFILRMHTQNSWALANECELLYVLMEMRRQMFDHHLVQEMADPPNPLHMTWAEL